MSDPITHENVVPRLLAFASKLEGLTNRRPKVIVVRPDVWRALEELFKQMTVTHKDDMLNGSRLATVHGMVVVVEHDLQEPMCIGFNLSDFEE